PKCCKGLAGQCEGNVDQIHCRNTRCRVDLHIASGWSLLRHTGVHNHPWPTSKKPCKILNKLFKAQVKKNPKAGAFELKLGKPTNSEEPFESVTSIHPAFQNKDRVAYYRWKTLIELNLVPDKLGRGVGKLNHSGEAKSIELFRLACMDLLELEVPDGQRKQCLLVGMVDLFAFVSSLEDDWKSVMNGVPINYGSHKTNDVGLSMGLPSPKPKKKSKLKQVGSINSWWLDLYNDISWLLEWVTLLVQATLILGGFDCCMIPSITTMDEEDYYDPRADLDRLPVGKIDFPSFTTPYQHESYPAFNGGPNLSAEQLEIFAAWRQLAITGKLLQELAR
ncbi:hypothetical protein MJO29_017031, partial [Puccinia striiformis f. sp. tritici]